MTTWARAGESSFYICQSIVLGTIYGYGFDLFGNIGMATGLALTLAIYVLQILARNWWLNRYRFGPSSGSGEP